MVAEQMVRDAPLALKPPLLIPITSAHPEMFNDMPVPLNGPYISLHATIYPRQLLNFGYLQT